MANIIEKALSLCNPDPAKAGKTLMWLNVLGMLFAAASDTYAAASDKNTSKEDKKFLVPAGICTGIAKIGIYFGMTNKIVDAFEGKTDKVIAAMGDKFESKAFDFAAKEVEKATKGGLFGFGKKSKEVIESMEQNFFEAAQDGAKKVSEYGKKLFKDNIKAGLSVAGAFVGAIIGCAIVAPIIRDVGAYFIQKQMKKRNPDATEGPFISYTPTYMAKNMFGAAPMNISTYKTAVKQGMKI